jgi:hypothetical protein
MTKKDLDRLRKKLPRGYAKILSEKTGKHTSAIYQALTGKINSPEIIEAAIELAKENQQKNADLKRQIDSL